MATYPEKYAPKGGGSHNAPTVLMSPGWSPPASLKDSPEPHPNPSRHPHLNKTLLLAQSQLGMGM